MPKASRASPDSAALQSPPVAADTFAQARRAIEAINVEWELLDVTLDPEEAVRREQFTMPSSTYERGDFEKALASADVVIEGTYRTSVVLHNSMETHQAVCEWVGDTLNVYISTQYIWGGAQRRRRGARDSG